MIAHYKKLQSSNWKWFYFCIRSSLKKLLLWRDNSTALISRLLYCSECLYIKVTQPGVFRFHGKPWDNKKQIPFIESVERSNSRSTAQHFGNVPKNTQPFTSRSLNRNVSKPEPAFRKKNKFEIQRNPRYPRGWLGFHPAVVNKSWARSLTASEVEAGEIKFISQQNSC